MMFDFCVLFVDGCGVEGIVHCPSERVADGVLEAFTGLFAVKYPSRLLV